MENQRIRLSKAMLKNALMGVAMGLSGGKANPVVLQKLIQGIDVPGYATIIVLILLLGSVQLFCIGIIGEYVGRTFEQSKDRPIYIAKEVLDYEQN